MRGWRWDLDFLHRPFSLFRFELVFGCRFNQHLVVPLHLLGMILGDVSVLGGPLLLVVLRSKSRSKVRPAQMTISASTTIFAW